MCVIAKSNPLQWVKKSHRDSLNHDSLVSMIGFIVVTLEGDSETNVLNCEHGGEKHREMYRMVQCPIFNEFHINVKLSDTFRINPSDNNYMYS